MTGLDCRVQDLGFWWFALNASNCLYTVKFELEIHGVLQNRENQGDGGLQADPYAKYYLSDLSSIDFHVLIDSQVTTLGSFTSFCVPYFNNDPLTFNSIPSNSYP